MVNLIYCVTFLLIEFHYVINNSYDKWNLYDAPDGGEYNNETAWFGHGHDVTKPNCRYCGHGQVKCCIEWMHRERLVLLNERLDLKEQKPPGENAHANDSGNDYSQCRILNVLYFVNEPIRRVKLVLIAYFFWKCIPVLTVVEPAVKGEVNSEYHECTDVVRQILNMVPVLLARVVFYPIRKIVFVSRNRADQKHC